MKILEYSIIISLLFLFYQGVRFFDRVDAQPRVTVRRPGALHQVVDQVNRPGPPTCGLVVF